VTTTTATATPTKPPIEGWASALAVLPGCGQHRLTALLDAFGHDPAAAWRAVVDGDRALPEVLGRGGAVLAARWRSSASSFDVGRAWSQLADDGVGLWLHHHDGYPDRLADDPDPPPILFWRGDPQALERPAVAIVGTRRCTAYGSDVARSLGRDLTAAGVSVISGLALGIDGAAHEGALAARLVDAVGEGDAAGTTEADRSPACSDLGAPPIGVVGSGLDVVYPPRHRLLWRRIEEHGLLLTESPPGAAPEPWRFPRRNRILAALADLVVVVESHASGGSLSTVRAATDRGVTVMAVPGSVRSPSSAGTNRLLADGVAPVTDTDDVLVALALEGVTLHPTSRGGPTSPRMRDAGEEPEPDDAVLRAVDWTPTSTEDILRRTGFELPAVSRRLTELELRGRVRRRGGWWERVGTPR
jgi:DNA processing protein